MTIRAVLACDGVWNGTDTCRQAIPVGIASSGADARRIAATVGGWSSHLAGDNKVGDFCPACTKRQQEGRVPKPRPVCDRPHVEVTE